MKTGTDRILRRRLCLFAALFFPFLFLRSEASGSDRSATDRIAEARPVAGRAHKNKAGAGRAHKQAGAGRAHKQAAGDAFSEYSKKADALIAEKGLKKSRLGLVISFLPDSSGEEESVLYHLNADRLFIPASLVKTASLSAFNHYFPPGFRFQTRLLSAGTQTGDRLQGDLVIQGGGDPGFTSEYLWSLVNTFQRTGVKIIEGDIAADDSLYKPVRFEAPSSRSYYAPPSAASFNWNSVAFWLAPAGNPLRASRSATGRVSAMRSGGSLAKAGLSPAAPPAKKSSVGGAVGSSAVELLEGPAARIHIDPENSYIKTVNNLKSGRKTAVQIRFLSAGASKASPSAEIRSSTGRASETFSFTGFFSPKEGEKVFYRAVRNPPLWLGNNLLHFLKRRGVSVTGTVKKGTVQTGAVATGAVKAGAVQTRAVTKEDCLPPCQVLASHKSRPLLQHTYNMMKYSNNFVTRMLTSHLPLIQGERRGDFERGVRLIETYLSKRAGLSGFRFHEPTGLSRENRFSPAHIKALLLKDKDGFLGPEALSSYPLAAAAGTLEKRFPHLKAGAFVRAKTGSLEGVTGLAGFAQNSSFERFVFVFIYNGPARRVPRAEALFDSLTEALLQ